VRKNVYPDLEVALKELIAYLEKSREVK